MSWLSGSVAHLVEEQDDARLLNVDHACLRSPPRQVDAQLHTGVESV